MICYDNVTILKKQPVFLIFQIKNDLLVNMNIIRMHGSIMGKMMMMSCKYVSPFSFPNTHPDYLLFFLNRTQRETHTLLRPCVLCSLEQIILKRTCVQIFLRIAFYFKERLMTWSLQSWSGAGELVPI